MTAFQRAPLGGEKGDVGTDHLHSLRCAAAAIAIEDRHDFFQDDQEEQEDRGLEIVDDEEEEDGDLACPATQPPLSVVLPFVPDRAANSSPAGAARREDGTEEIVRNALFLLALKHPSLKQQEPQHSNPRPNENVVDATKNRGVGEEGCSPVPTHTPTEADWKGREDVCLSTSDKRQRREVAKRVYRDQRRQRRRERRRGRQEQERRSPPTLQRSPESSLVSALALSPSPWRALPTDSGSCSPPPPLSDTAHPPTTRRLRNLMGVSSLPSPLSSPLAPAASLPLPALSASLTASRKRKRISRRHSDDGEATSYDEDADNDEEIDYYHDGDAEEDEEEEALLLCDDDEEEEEEEQILDSGSTSAIGHSRKRKRPVERKRATSDQVVVLEKMYNEDKFPSSELIRQTGERLGMKPSKVKNWFQNKRAKERRVAAGKDRSSKAKKGSTTTTSSNGGGCVPAKKQQQQQVRPIGSDTARTTPAVASKAKEAEDVPPRQRTTRHAPPPAANLPMEVDEPAPSMRPAGADDSKAAAAARMADGFSSSLPFSFLSEGRRLASLPPAPPKKRYTLNNHQQQSSDTRSPATQAPAGRPCFLLPPLMSSSPSLHFLSPPLTPTLPTAPHQCQRQ